MSDHRKNTTRAQHSAKPEATGSKTDGPPSDTADIERQTILDDPKVVRLLADNEFSQALGRIYGLARDNQKAAGGRESEALLLYVSLAVNDRRRIAKRGKRRETPKQQYERCFARDTGKTWKALTEFPDRIRRIANEMEDVSRSHVFDPKRITSEVPSAMYAKWEFPTLPKALRNYARWLEAKVTSTSAFMKSFYLQTPRGRLSLYTVNVSEEVKLITGQYRHRYVADLLNAADLVLNPIAAKNGPRFDEQNVALLRSRHQRKATLKHSV